MSKTRNHESLGSARLIMVLSSISPLFIFWAIRGSKLIANSYFIADCIVMVVIPNAFLFLRLTTARKQKDMREIVVGRAEDHRDPYWFIYLRFFFPFTPQASGIGESFPQHW